MNRPPSGKYFPQEALAGYELAPASILVLDFPRQIGKVSKVRGGFATGFYRNQATNAPSHQSTKSCCYHYVVPLYFHILFNCFYLGRLEAEIAILKAHSGEAPGRPLYRHNQQLEELRNLQDKLQSEREVWQREKDTEMRELQQKKNELTKLKVGITISNSLSISMVRK